MVSDSPCKIPTIFSFWLQFRPNSANFLLIPVELYICFKTYPLSPIRLPVNILR